MTKLKWHETARIWLLILPLFPFYAMWALVEKSKDWKFFNWLISRANDIEDRAYLRNLQRAGE